MKFSQIEDIITESLEAAEEERRQHLKLASAPTSVEGSDLDHQVEKLAAVYDYLAREPDAIVKVSMAPHNGSDSPEVQPPTDEGRSTTEKMDAKPTPNSPHTDQNGVVAEPATDVDRSTTEFQSPEPVLKQSSDLQAHVYATAQIFEAANQNRMPDINKIAADSGLSRDTVQGILTNIVNTNKTAQESIPAAKEEEEGPPPKEEGNEGQQPAPEPTEQPTESKEKAAECSSGHKKKEKEKKDEKSSPKVAGAENESAASPTEYAAGEGGSTSPEAQSFLSSHEAAVSFKKRQAKLVSNQKALSGLFDTNAYKDPVVHRHFEHANEAGVKTTPGGQS
jgi:hypothetical protein